MENKTGNEKSLLKIKLENEARAKEITDREQIKELNRALVQGLDLNKAAKSIFGPGPDQKTDQKSEKNSGNEKLKSKDTIRFNQNWTE